MSWIFVKQTSVAWTPDNLSTAPLLWLDAQSLSGLSDGDTVSSWTASAGTSPTMNGTCTYETSEIGSYPAVMIGNAAGDYLGLSNVSISSGDSVSMYQVGKMYEFNATPGGFWRYSEHFNIVGGSRPYFRTTGSGNNFNPASGYSIPVNSTGTAAPVMLTWVNRNAAGYDFYANGTLEHTAAHGATVPAGSISYYGYQNSTNALIKHTIGELLFFDYALVQSDREKLEGYLSHRWGMTADLPAGHPYKNAAPTV